MANIIKTKFEQIVKHLKAGKTAVWYYPNISDYVEIIFLYGGNNYIFSKDATGRFILEIEKAVNIIFNARGNKIRLADFKTFNVFISQDDINNIFLVNIKNAKKQIIKGMLTD